MRLHDVHVDRSELLRRLQQHRLGRVADLQGRLVAQRGQRPQPRVGGSVYDVAEDGSECRWARVLAYEPYDRVVFSWDIGPDWQLVADTENASEVEVRFTAETPQRTRIELEHRDIDRHGPGWEAVREGIAGDGGWPLYLDRYASLFTEDG